MSQSNHRSRGYGFARGLFCPVQRHALISLGGFAILAALFLGSAAAADRPEFAPNQVIVQFKPNAKASAAQDASREMGATLQSTLPLPRTHLYQLRGRSVPEAVQALRRNPNVAFAQPNYYYHTATTTPCDPSGPNCDEFFWRQYALQNTGQQYDPNRPAGTAGADIGTPRAWDLTTGSSSILVAILDTGVDWEHPDLAANIWTNPGESGLDAQGHDKTTNGVDDDGNGKVDDWHGWDFAGYGYPNSPGFDNDPANHDSGYNNPAWHGTHVAGIVGAVGHNGIGVSGVAWNVSLLPCKLCTEGQDGIFTTQHIIQAIDYSIAVGAKVINASFGTYFGAGCNNYPGYDFSDESLRQAIEAADGAGVIFVAAAGNCKNDNDIKAFFPASFALPNIVSVAGSDATDNIWSMSLGAFDCPACATGDGYYGSNYGATSVDLAAPGSYIFSTAINVYGVPVYFDASGTSMAAPQVAGAFALLLSAFPDMNPHEAIARVLETVDPIPAWTGKTVTGGRLNIGRAMDFLPPGAVTDLASGTITTNSAVIQWSAPGDKTLEHAVGYDLRYDTVPLINGAFDDAAQVPNLPIPAAKGTIQSVQVSGLDPLTHYYFALKSWDDVGNISEISNAISVTTLGPDIQAPTTPVAFGNVTFGNSSTRQVTISNTGTSALNVNSMELTAYFTWAGPGSSFQPVQIAPAGNFVCTLRFTPEFTGMHYGTLTIGSDDPDENPLTVNLQGRGSGYFPPGGSSPQPIEPLPTIHALRQSAPNPTKMGARIGFDLPVEENVRLDVFDLQGRSVQTLINGVMPAGRHQADWNGLGSQDTRVPPGIYFYRIKTPTFEAVRKLLVVP